MVNLTKVPRACTACGSPLTPGALYCTGCGQPVSSETESDLPVERAGPPAGLPIPPLAASSTPPPAASAAPPVPEAAGGPLLPPPPPAVAQAPQTAPSANQQRRSPVLVAGLAALLVLLVGGGLYLLLRHDSSVPPTAGSTPSGSQPAPSTPAGSDSSSDNTENPTSPAEDEPEVGECWNGVTIDRNSEVCDLPTHSTQLLRYAFPISWSDCETTKGADYNVLSYGCDVRGARVHIATFSDAASKNARLRQYGYPDACEDTDDDRLLCGPTGGGRYAVLYDNPEILLYATATDPGALEALPQRSADDLLYGR